MELRRILRREHQWTPAAACLAIVALLLCISHVQVSGPVDGTGAASIATGWFVDHDRSHHHHDHATAECSSGPAIDHRTAVHVDVQDSASVVDALTVDIRRETVAEPPNAYGRPLSGRQRLIVMCVARN
ncbi:hypothetical protein Val02_49190 [Virgisporangium aliadipatigenens]|uniref:Uncharacterized protein n=1 Tax=Virgisporangium aliadipatigenens TaxID=741659 RepID=A0A8J3YPP4_9ACTN|nr:hypothetical protein [Virgisporangium aliadipatigenens]GIJ48033.1 hypothetical protein Val02_49190 [Virgisporangium aliadipatigenens]